jgi:hypothetical protein
MRELDPRIHQIKKASPFKKMDCRVVFLTGDSIRVPDALQRETPLR